MNDEMGRGACDEDLAFFGRISADVSHDMRNVLAIIGENAGLLDDLLSVTAPRGTIDIPKLKTLGEKIAKQVKKGTEIMDRFSRFAHATNEPIASFDVTALTETMARLAERHVRLAGSTLETELPRKAIPVRFNSLRLLRSVFSAIQLVLDSQESRGVVKIRLAKTLRTAVITVSGAVLEEREPADRIAQLSVVMNEIGGSATASCAKGVFSAAISVPRG